MKMRLTLREFAFFIVIIWDTRCVRIWDTLTNDFRLHKIARTLEARQLSGLFENDNITVFLPTSDAFFSFLANSDWYGIDTDSTSQLQEVLLYSSVVGRYLLEDMPRTTTAVMPSRLDPQLPLYINNLNTALGMLLTINGARLVDADITTDNGVIHLIDRVLAPLPARTTLTHYVEKPSMPQFLFESESGLVYHSVCLNRSIYSARGVVPNLTLETSRTDITFTSFSPNDSYLVSMPDYGQVPLFENWDLLKDVYMAHVIKGNAVFIPDGAVLNEVKALAGTIRFSRHRGNNYISNGRVRARVVQANVPVLNGVLHVIDNLLYYVYHDVMQMANILPNTKKMSNLLSGLHMSLQMSLKNRSQSFTVFLPTDDAFAKIPTSVQQRLDVDSDFLRKVVMGHIIEGTVIDADNLLDNTTLTALNNERIRVVHENKEIILEVRGLKSKVEVQDLGVTNGIVHLIDCVLFLNNFTVWEAVFYSPLLSQMKELMQNFDDLVNVLRSNSRQLTVFLAPDVVMTKASDYVISLLRDSRNQVYKALQGHIGTTTVSSYMTNTSLDLLTLAGTKLVLSMDTETQELSVTGGHVTARVTVKDIWCSNGVLHIVDEILHLPTRTLLEEIKTRPKLKYMYTLFETVRNDLFSLNSSRDLTLFVADNDAFSSLPWPSINTLLSDLNRTRMILQAHVVPGETRFLEDIPDGTGLQAFQNVVYLLTKNGKRYVINNNLWAEVVAPDIPAVNGRMHIINRLLYIPYNNISYLLNTMEELMPFHILLSEQPDYMNVVMGENKNVTLFIPSARYLRTVTSQQMSMMRSDIKVLKRLFFGHTLPQVRIDDLFLGQYGEESHIQSKSSFNITFTIQRTSEGVFVDAGYDTLILDVIGRAYGCTNGVIYVIDGFLNYSPFTILQRLKREPSVSRSLLHMIVLPPPADIELLNLPNTSFTFLMPDDLAVDFMTLHDISYLHNMRHEDRRLVFWRHVLSGSEVTYEDLRDGHVNAAIMPPEVSFSKSGTGLYFRYQGINSRVTRWNLVACNGIIHLISHYLYAPPTAIPTQYTEDTPTPRTDPVQAGRAWSLFVGSKCSILLTVLTVHVLFAANV